MFFFFLFINNQTNFSQKRQRENKITTAQIENIAVKHVLRSHQSWTDTSPTEDPKFDYHILRPSQDETFLPAPFN